MNNQPAHKLRLGRITATIWENDGFYSVDISRSYKGQDGAWKSTSSFGHADLLIASKCLERAEIWIGRKINANT